MGKSSKIRDPCIWFVCKSCGRAYQHRKFLVRHKRQFHPRPPEKSKTEDLDSRQSVEMQENLLDPNDEPKGSSSLGSKDRPSLSLVTSTWSNLQNDEKNALAQLESFLIENKDDDDDDDDDGVQGISAETEEEEEEFDDDERNFVINLSKDLEQADEQPATQQRAGRGRGRPRDKNDKKTHKCEFCGKILSSKGSLEVHNRLHSGVKPYSCIFCHKSFALKGTKSDGNCRVHERIHTGERPYRCPVNFCTKSFTQASQLKSHTQSVHGCYVSTSRMMRGRCGRSKSTQESKIHHEDDDQLEPLELTSSATTKKVKVSESSDKKVDNEVMLIDAWRAAAAVVAVVSRGSTSPTFVSSGPPPRRQSAGEDEGRTDSDHQQVNGISLTKEKRLYECRFCHKQMSQPQALKVHERIHTGERPFVCSFAVCRKSFNQQSALKTHERVHTGERPYSCRFCPKKFAASSTRQVHETRHKHNTLSKITSTND